MTAGDMKSVPYPSLRYNQVQQKSSHNSYRRDEGLADQLVYWRLRDVELDIHNVLNPAAPLAGDWFVYHSRADTNSSVYRLSDALALLQGFHFAIPAHEVVTVALDLKDDFDKTHTPDDLDALIRKYLGGAVFTPAQLLSKNRDLQAAVQRDGWPLLADLRGKFIFICTTGDLDAPTNHLNQYVDNGQTANTRVCFVAPDISRASQITLKNYAVFFNMQSAYAPQLGPAVLEQGFVSRSYTSDISLQWSAASEAKNHIIATDKVNADHDPWARTDNANGFPFRGLEVDVDPSTTEPGVVVGMVVKSGDIWGSADSCGFIHEDCAGALDNTYVYAISVPGSHVNEWAKVGLLARTSREPGAENFCVIRPAGANPVRSQCRSVEAGRTTATALSSSLSIDASGWMLLRLAISGGGLKAEGAASLDGVHWTSLGSATFSAPLRYQGIACSSHDAKQAVRFLAIPIAAPRSFSTKAAIGDGTEMNVFPGVYPPNA